jgi:hypothetical protein
MAACAFEAKLVERNRSNDFATRYTATWCSQDPASVAAFFAEGGALEINNGIPSVKMDDLRVAGDRITFHWTLVGTNTGPAGTGNRVRIRGYEEWRIGLDGLIAESRGHFDEVDYQRQLKADSACD